MRVLHLPVNIASIPSHTVRLLRQIGVEARGLVYDGAVVHSSEGMQVIDTTVGRYSPRWLWRKFRWAVQFVCSIHWADVLHWYFGSPALPGGLDLAWVKWLRKPALVEWMGSEIRAPEIELADNPYYAAALRDGYEYAHLERPGNSRRLQQRFADAGFASGAALGVAQYVRPDIFPSSYILPQRIVLADYRPAYPDPANRRPVVVHSPTAPVAKGTAAVIEAVAQLKSAHDFEFRLVRDVPRAEALAIVQSADIFLDQFVLGDRGMASLEAMALGKPVVCYIKPALLAQYPADLPIVNATQETLATTLAELLRDGALRHDLGRRGRAYVERHHDGIKIAPLLKAVYEELIARRSA